MTARLAVFLSGGGRTMTNLADAIDRGNLDAEISLVVANKECKGADRARERGFKTRIIPGVLDPADLDALAADHAIDYIVLAGYLKLLPITPALEGRIVNIHPALLPDFGGPGMHGAKVHAAVIAAAQRGETNESGCTVHLCDTTFDTGRIVLQLRCPVLPDDTTDALAARVFELERQAYPAALKLLISGNANAESAE